MEGLSCTVAGNGVLGRKTLDDGSSFLFHAGNIRKERTGLHAKLSLGVGDIILGDDTFNVDRLGDRSRLAKYVYEKMSGGFKAAYPLDVLTHDLDGFCRNIWKTWLSTIVAEERGGTAERMAPVWLIFPYLVKGGGTILFGPPKMGKSFTLQTIAVSLDAGSDDIWGVDVPHRVLYVNLERSRDAMDRRIGDINSILGFGRDRKLLRLDRRGWSIESVAEAVEETVKRYEVECVVWDSLSRAGMGGLVKDEVANKAMDMMNTLSPTWITAGHVARMSGEHVFGSTMYEAAADVLVKVTTTKTDTELAVGLEVTAANDVGHVPMRVIAYTFDDTGLTGIRRAKMEEFPVLKAGRQMQPAEAVEDYIMDNGVADAETIAKVLEKSRAFVSSILANDKRFAKAGTDGHKVLYGLRAYPS